MDWEKERAHGGFLGEVTLWIMKPAAEAPVTLRIGPITVSPIYVPGANELNLDGGM